MKPKLTIPHRSPKTPEQVRVDEHFMMIQALYIRWINNELLPTDDFLLIEHIDRLEQIEQQADWQAKFRMEHLNWKVEQMNLNNPKSEDSN